MKGPWRGGNAGKQRDNRNCPFGSARPIAGRWTSSTERTDSVELLQQLTETIDSIRDDYAKGKGGNKAAGTRVRKAMQDIKNMAQEIRQEMLNARSEEASSS